eukprot:scaffold7697_cov264-Chaetoceros_neogracile.AAC.3
MNDEQPEAGCHEINASFITTPFSAVYLLSAHKGRAYEHHHAVVSCNNQDDGILQEPNLALQMAKKLDEGSFWSTPRSTTEIVEQLSKIVFPQEDISYAANQIQVLSEDLPLIAIHNFLSKELCEEIIHAATLNGDFVRSTLGDTQSVSIQRTSSTTWLSKEHCEIPINALCEKASSLSGIPINNMENLQVVRYNGNGEKFDIHTDHLKVFNDLDCRGRIATCLIYLNSSKDALEDGSEEDFIGGETCFPEYDVNVKPRCGTAVFWFNTIQRPGVEGYAPMMDLDVDLRSRHAGMPVFLGNKWVCNLWMHPVMQR